MFNEEILDILNMGIVVLDRSFKVQEWNRWMTFHSRMERKDILDQNLFHFFPDLNNPSFLRTCKSVFTFGTIIYLSQKIHSHLFPFKVLGSYSSHFDLMQQSCTISPLKQGSEEVSTIVITVQDVTETVIVEKRLRTLNALDGLTAIYNRRYLNLRLQEEVYRQKRYGAVMSLIIFDIDHFKNINDTHGHACGDYVLQKLCILISTLIRDVDVFARYGGEEFVLLLPETGAQGALILAERIRKAVEEYEFQYESTNRLHITVSLGVATHNQLLATPEQFLKAADKALYEAKKGGRNCLKVYSERRLPG